MSSSLYGGKGASPSGTMKSNTSTGNYNTSGWNEQIPEGYETTRIQKFTPQQMQQHEQMFQYAAPDSYLSRLAGGDQSMFKEVEAPALRQFNELQGNMASRFSGMGSGARRSSGFQNAGNQAASNFAQQLQSNRQGLQRQALTDLRGLSGELLSANPYEVGLQDKPQGFDWGSAIGAVGGGIAGFYAGGPSGAMTGAQMGSSMLGRGGGGSGGFQSTPGWIPSWSGNGGMSQSNSDLLKMAQGTHG